MGEPLTQQKLDAAIIRLITKKLLPISMVEDEHFREFILSMFDLYIGQLNYNFFYTHFIWIFHSDACIQIRRKLSIEDYVSP